MAVIDEPAVARAIDRCLLARSLADRRGPVTRVHPRPCGWCDWPLPELRRLLEGFNAWAGWDERRRTYARHDVRVWTEEARRNPEEAERQIVIAQDFPQATEPMTPSAEPPAREPGGTHRAAPEAYQPSASFSPGEATDPVFLPEPIDEEYAAWTS